MVVLNNIQSAVDTMAQPLGLILDTTKVQSTQESYKFYTGTLDAGNSPLIIDAESDLGRLGLSGYIFNNSASDFTASFSADGVNYGDDITIPAGSVWSFAAGSYWFKFSLLKLTKGSGDSDIQVFII